MNLTTGILLTILGIVFLIVSRKTTLLYIMCLLVFYGNLPWWENALIFIVVLTAISGWYDESGKKGN